MGLQEDVITNATRIIILKLQDQGFVGILVDSVNEVFSLGESEIERNFNTKDSKSNFINGIGKNEARLISLFDIDKIATEASK